ncbi:MAG: sigma-70 family RNA polymerase sigma factor [Acidimicrobiales bacterium]
MDIEAIEESVALPFEAFYDLHRDSVARALALTLGDPGLAGEACDEAMVRAYQRWNRIGRYDNPAGWVYRVGLNWSRSWIRKRSRMQLGEAVDDAVESVVNDGVLEAAVARLSIKLRAVVVMRYYLDWSTEQTAVALGVAEGTVKSRLSRALDRLADELGPEVEQ